MMLEEITILRGTVAAALVTVLLTAMPLFAESSPLPGQRSIEDFQQTSDWQFELEGEARETAEIYHSQREVAYLVIGAGMDRPLLVSPRGKSVQTVPATAIVRQADGAMLDGGSATESLGTYTLTGDAMRFEIDGQTAMLRPRPALLGNQSQDAVVERSPQYARTAQAYSLVKGVVSNELPVDGERVRIRVYFGSWSEICGELVPKIMRVEEEWRSQGVRFEYYGVPQPITDDAVAVAEGILGVPTAVAYVDGEEVGRLSGRPLNTPDTSLREILSAAPSR